MSAQEQEKKASREAETIGHKEGSDASFIELQRINLESKVQQNKCFELQTRYEQSQKELALMTNKYNSLMSMQDKNDGQAHVQFANENAELKAENEHLASKLASLQEELGKYFDYNDFKAKFERMSVELNAL